MTALTRRLRLRTILLVVNVVILCLPLGGIAVLRIYESALIRQTESELIAQGAFIAAAYRAAWARLVAGPESGTPGDYGLPLAPEWQSWEPAEERWRPRQATLDLTTETIRPPQPAPRPPEQPVDRLAFAVGQELTPLLRDAQVVTLAGIRVVDYQGTIVASTGEELGLSMRDSEEVARALRGEPVSLLRERIPDQPPPPLSSISRGSLIRVFVATPILQETRVLGAVVLSRTPSTLGSTLYGKRYLLLKLGLTLFGVVLLLAIFTSLTITRPVQALIDQAGRAVRGEKGAVVPLARPVTQEIAQLSEAVAGMAQTLEQRADYIRTFAAHVSHEFKTPLTAMQGAVELLRDHFTVMSGEERERFLSNLAEDAARLERLVRRLLDLARAEVLTPGTETAEVAAVVAGVVDRYRRQGMAVEVEQEAAVPKAAMSAETLDAILSQLLDNARQHGAEAVTVTVRIGGQAGSDPGRVLITVADDGPGISPANAARIFEPFFTTARKQGGTGLGLTVVRALLAAHQGGIEWLPSAAGSVFRVVLRAAG